MILLHGPGRCRQQQMGSQAVEHRLFRLIAAALGRHAPEGLVDAVFYKGLIDRIAVRLQTIQKLIQHGGKAIAVGTTSVRTLESLYYMGVKVLCNPNVQESDLHVNQWEPYEENSNKSDVRSALQALLDWLDRNGLKALHSSTQIIIAPGYEYKIVKMLVTNFHQPQSTLLLLVSAFVHGDWHKIYDYAIAHDFRFLSYGDSSLLIP